MKQLTSKEWHDWRAGGITGSEAPIIMKTSPWAKPEDLFKRRMGMLPPQEQTYPMRRGIELEPDARALYENSYGIEVPARCLTSEKWVIARASFDGLNEELAHAIEIKCPGKEDHILALCGKIPPKYLFQLVHQMFVADLETIDYVSYNPDSFAPQHQLARVVLQRDLKLENALLAEERVFWGYIKDKQFPGLEMPKPKAPEPAKKWSGFPVRQSRPAKPSRALIPPQSHINAPRADIVPFRRREGDHD